MRARRIDDNRYHNFHHQFPMDYRNGPKWYHIDTAKWFIYTCYRLGLVKSLYVFPQNEVRKAELSMKLRKLEKQQEGIKYPAEASQLPVVEWDTCTSATLYLQLRILFTFIFQSNRRVSLVR